MNQTILLLDPAPDRLVEYSFDGEFVGTPFLAADDDFIGLGSGFPNGIYYDSETARLYVISSIGDLAVWEDLSRLELPGDVNCDGSVDLLDVGPFVDLLTP